jgi:hypothetical protein
MISRVFPEVSIPFGTNQATKAMRITCAHCGGLAYFPVAAGSNTDAPGAAVQHFQNKGWVVGGDPETDFCRKHSTPAKRRGPKAMTTSAVMADKPREMGREDRRIINDKLDEVYGRDAYRAPWTDAAVAKDLGVPRDWVVQVRDQFFGPAGSNPLYDQFLGETEHLEKSFRAFAATCAAAEQAGAAQRQAHAELTKQMDAYRALARKVEREIGR